MAKMTCAAAMAAGALARERDPLHRGAYKLREVRSWTTRCLEDVEVISKYKGKALIGRLRHCTSDDKVPWLKARPADIAHDLGYYVLPGIAALIGDGLPPIVVNRLAKEAEAAAGLLVARCQSVHDLIYKNINHEYLHMENGESMVGALLSDMLCIVDRALDKYNWHEAEQQLLQPS